MNKDAKIYVAGHTGLVGSAIVGKLRGLGCGNLVLNTHAELALCRQKETEEFFERERPEYVFLAAARVGGIMANSLYKADFIYDNTAIATNIIHSSWKYGVKKLVNLGSSCIYPKMAPQPLKEEYLLSGYLEPTNDAYAVAKIAAIKMCNSYNEQHGTDFISAMPTNLYVPGDNFDLVNSHVLPAMVRKMHLAKLLDQGRLDLIARDFAVHGNGRVVIDDREYDAGVGAGEETVLKVLSHFGIEGHASSTVLTLWGDGSPLREFLYSEDLADALLFLMEKASAAMLPHGFVNIGSGTDLPIRDLAGMVKDAVGFTGRIEWDTAKPNGTPRKLMDVSEMRRLGWQYRTSLEDGIERYYAWYLGRSAPL
jgi:GDP-L-fucose synthase